MLFGVAGLARRVGRVTGEGGTHASHGVGTNRLQVTAGENSGFKVTVRENPRFQVKVGGKPGFYSEEKSLSFNSQGQGFKS